MCRRDLALVARCMVTALARASLAPSNTAMKPSPRLFTSRPRCTASAPRIAEKWAAANLLPRLLPEPRRQLGRPHQVGEQDGQRAPDSMRTCRHPGIAPGPWSPVLAPQRVGACTDETATNSRSYASSAGTARRHGVGAGGHLGQALPAPRSALPPPPARPRRRLRSSCSRRQPAGIALLYGAVTPSGFADILMAFAVPLLAMTSLFAEVTVALRGGAAAPMACQRPRGEEGAAEAWDAAVVRLPRAVLLGGLVVIVGAIPAEIYTAQHSGLTGTGRGDGHLRRPLHRDRGRRHGALLPLGAGAPPGRASTSPASCPQTSDPSGPPGPLPASSWSCFPS